MKKIFATLGVVLGGVALTAAVLWIKPELFVKATFPALPQPVASSQVLSADDDGEIRFPSKTPYDLEVVFSDPQLGADSTGVGTLYLPDNASRERPVPLMLVVHGSGGISPGREESYVEFFNSKGLAAFVLDYYTPRGVAGDVPYMTKVLGTTEFDAISDAYHSLKVLRTHPKIDGSRVGIIGMSYGGMVARFAMDERIKTAFIGQQPGFKLFIDMYGPCFQNLNSSRLAPGPLLTLRGTEDNSNELPACEKREAELRALGAIVETEVYQGAGHAWENTRPREMIEEAPYITGCESSYDKDGRPLVNGKAVIDVPAGASRETRIVARMRSSSVFQDCVQYGYIIGRDEKTHRLANARIEQFIDKYL